MPKQTGLREQKQRQVQQAIYEAAMRLFTAKGFDAVTVEEIAAEAGVSRATYFNHFGTKEGVLRHFGEQLEDRMVSAAAAVAPDMTPLEQIQALLRIWADYTAVNREQVRLVYVYSIRDPRYLTELTPARRRLFDLFITLVAAGQQAGQIRPDLPARHLAMHLLSVYQNGLMAYLQGWPDLEALLDSAWKFIGEGLFHVHTHAG